MLRKLTVNLNIMTALSVFYVIIFKNEWFSENFWSGGGWVFVLTLVSALVTGLYLKVTRFEKESYMEGRKM
ncbi:MAG: hypothetical protein R3E13_08705 [Alphaproteobacteria bacterium]